MAKTEFGKPWTEPVEVARVQEEDKKDIKPKTKGAFVHIVKDDGTEVWFFADIPEAIANSYPHSGAAEVELILLP